ncbi:MAG: hypothetical protein M1823_000294 [Watsoniomyces obsoletus]|nr:MAG: hypothetical protein M1823_000294 [Watsoniomyces obsoletus]
MRVDYLRRHCLTVHASVFRPLRPHPNPTAIAVESGPSSQANGISSSTNETSNSNGRRTTVADILSVLDQQENPWNRILLKWIRERKQWYSMDDLTTTGDARPSWADSRPLPRLFNAEVIWHPRPATNAELWEAAMTEIRRGAMNPTYQVYNLMGERCKDEVATAFRQIHLRRPEDEEGEDEWIDLQRNPITLFNLAVPTLKQSVQIPTYLEPELQFDQHPPALRPSVNATPKFALVDVHIDLGMEVVSLCVGRCRKIWFLWPPTSGNLWEMTRLGHRHPDRLIQTNLDHGVLVETDRTVGIHLPAGWLHATLTIEGGFLIGITPIAAESIDIITNYFSSELLMSPSDTDESLNVYIRGLRTALRSAKPQIIRDAVDGWSRLGPRLQVFKTGRGNKILGDKGKELRAVWEDFLLRRSALGEDLAPREEEEEDVTNLLESIMATTKERCCDLDDPGFPKHFRTVHLAPVFSVSRSRG